MSENSVNPQESAQLLQSLPHEGNSTTPGCDAHAMRVDANRQACDIRPEEDSPALPIGTLFLWGMDRRSANLILQSAEILPSFNSTNKHICFVIDGQQRLTVMY